MSPYYTILNKISATVLAGYNQLAGSASDSPLVTRRGSPNQASIGIFLLANSDLTVTRKALELFGGKSPV